MKMETYDKAPETAKKESVIESLLGELNEGLKNIDIGTRDLYKTFNLILKERDTNNPSPVMEMNEEIGAYSPLANRLKDMIELTRQIGQRLENLTADSEIW